MRRALVASLLCLPPFFAACGDDGSTVVELTVIETIPVQFEQMDANVAEGTTVSLASLTEEPAFASSRADLACGSLDVAKSFLTIEALTSSAGATGLEYQVDVAPRGGVTYTPLAHFSGSVAQGDKVPMTDPKVTIDADGLTQVNRVILGDNPSLDVRVTATVPGELANLQVAVSLALYFSSDKNGCPSLTTGL